MEVSLRQITIASDPERTFFLKVEWKEDFGAGFVILLCDGTSAWTGEVSEEEVSREAQEMEMARERYVDDLQVALTGEGPAALDYAFHLTAERGQGHGSAGGLHLSYEKVQKDISFRLGAVELTLVPEPAAAVKGLIAHGLERGGRLHGRNQRLQQENEKLRREQQRITADMERYVTGKETLEQELYSRFVLVLNEKKAKIRALQARVKQLEESLEEEREQRKAAKAECSKAAESTGLGPSPVREESDYGASTEEEEEKEERPSSSGIRTSAKDAFRCSPIMEDGSSDITDVAPNRKRRHRHLQQLEAQAKRQALGDSHRSRNEQTHAKAEAKETAQRPAEVPKANPEPEDLFDDF
ncbi:DNA repair protein XRCC4 [Alosa pseudoharengus]|uniref:DNA repair protein XRCC4 n=1 Tax=Alosa pseudoharengus TaxID=34774 RepID=UPI003F8CA72C